MITKYAERHLKIRAMVQRIYREAGSPSIVITELTRELRLDPRIVRTHLEVMEIDGYGTLTNRKGSKKCRHIFKLNVEKSIRGQKK